MFQCLAPCQFGSHGLARNPMPHSNGLLWNIATSFVRNVCRTRNGCISAMSKRYAKSILDLDCQSSMFISQIKLTVQMGSRALAESDPQLAELIRKEKGRQTEGIELIASEVQKLSLLFPTCYRISPRLLLWNALARV